MTDLDVHVESQEVDINRKKWVGKIIFSLILILLLWWIFWFIFKNPLWWIVVWDEVSIHYDAIFINWDKFVSKDVTFVVWDWKVDHVVDDAVVGMKIWWTKHILVHSQEWYDKLYDSRKVQQIPGLVFEKMWVVPVEGKVYSFGNIKWIVTDIKWEWDSMVIVLDTNPLETYMDLEYVIEIVE